jgi:transposase
LEDVVGDGGVTWWNFYFRLFPGSIQSPQIIEFLSRLPRHIPGKLLIVWDGFARPWQPRPVGVHPRAARVWVEFLPGYAPELNPVEYLWSHWKQHELPNFCLQNLGQLSHYALRWMRKRPTLLIAFWRQAKLKRESSTTSSLPEQRR